MKIKDIKNNNPDYGASMIDALRMLDPSKNGKFIHLLLKEVIDSEKSMVMYSSDLDKLDINRKELPYTTQHILAMACDSVGGTQTILDLGRFQQLCDEGHIVDKDVQNYKSIGDISVVVLDAETKKLGNKVDYETQVIIDNEEWLVLKPLNMNASRKYGASTKWCTTQRDEGYFYDYSNKGVVLYILSKTSNVKWAIYYEHKKNMLSWWNTIDERVDGLMVDLPSDLKSRLLKLVLNEPHPNIFYFSEEEVTRGKKLMREVDFGIELPIVQVDEIEPLVEVDEIIDSDTLTIDGL